MIRVAGVGKAELVGYQASARGGVVRGRKLPKLGYRGVDTGEIVFEDCPVDAALSLVGGEEGKGFVMATGGLDPVTSNTIIEMIVKQRDVHKTSSLLVTHRLQDAFTMATHQFDQQTNQMRALPKGQYCDVPMSFLVLRDGKVIFDGDIHELAQSQDEYIREYIS